MRAGARRPGHFESDLMIRLLPRRSDISTCTQTYSTRRTGLFTFTMICWCSGRKHSRRLQTNNSERHFSASRRIALLHIAPEAAIITYFPLLPRRQVIGHGRHFYAQRNDDAATHTFFLAEARPCYADVIWLPLPPLASPHERKHDAADEPPPFRRQAAIPATHDRCIEMLLFYRFHAMGASTIYFAELVEKNTII